MSLRYGIDLGSRTVKIVGLEKDRLRYHQIFDTANFYREYGYYQRKKFNIKLLKLNIKSKNITTTGYGRNNLASAKKITEIIAHVQGAVQQTKRKNFTLLDIGGQDNKVILVKQGVVSDFKINDRCAAGSGKYLENMSHTLNISWDELSTHYKNPVMLHATCTVFGETELIGKMAEGISLNRLASGVNYSVFKRIQPDLIALFKGNPIVFVGGCARNQALLTFIKKEFKVAVIVPKYPRLNGAIGCAIS